MRADYWLFALLGIANATATSKRQDDGYEVDGGDYDPKYPEHDKGYKADPGYDASKGYGYDDYDHSGGDDYDHGKGYDYDHGKGYGDDGYTAKTPDPYPVKSHDPYPAKDPYPTKVAYPTKDAYPSKSYPTKGYPEHESYPSEHYPSDHDYPSDDYPSDDYPSKHYPSEDYPSKDYPSHGYPTKDYPTNDYPTKDYPANDYPTKQGAYDEYSEHEGGKHPWHPKTEHPEFFSLRVDDQCDDDELEADCPFDNLAIRLEKGIVIATTYNKWWDPKLPIFFVDDDTQLYTVSKKPLQLYIDTVTGSLRYAPVGWLPPDSIAYSFYKTGNNPLGRVDPSPATLSWPSTEGNTLAGAGPWSLCSLGPTGQYQVFVNADNYGGGVASGVWKDSAACKNESLAAINANPWKKGSEYPW